MIVICACVQQDFGMTSLIENDEKGGLCNEMIAVVESVAALKSVPALEMSSVCNDTLVVVEVIDEAVQRLDEVVIIVSQDAMTTYDLEKIGRELRYVREILRFEIRRLDHLF